MSHTSIPLSILPVYSSRTVLQGGAPLGRFAAQDSSPNSVSSTIATPTSPTSVLTPTSPTQPITETAVTTLSRAFKSILCSEYLTVLTALLAFVASLLIGVWQTLFSKKGITVANITLCKSFPDDPVRILAAVMHPLNHATDSV